MSGKIHHKNPCNGKSVQPARIRKAQVCICRCKSTGRGIHGGMCGSVGACSELSCEDAVEPGMERRADGSIPGWEHKAGLLPSLSAM